MAGVTRHLASLDFAEMNHALFCANDYGSNARNRFAPAGFHVAEHDHAGWPELDDRSRSDVVHELSARNLSLHILDDRNRRLRSGCPEEYSA